MELVIGVEPTTCWLQISCSAIEPHQQMGVCSSPKKCTWCLEVESNHRHQDFQSCALPTELSRHKWRSGRDLNSRPLAWQASALTNWATRPQSFARGKTGVWWTFRDSNPGQTGYEPGALTNWAKGPLVGVEGLEPPTSWSQAMRASNCATPRQYYAFYTILLHLSRIFFNFF